MADRTAARIFGTIFELLAENPTDDHKSIAKKIVTRFEKSNNHNDGSPNKFL